MIKNIAIQAVGSAISQSVPILVAPIVLRLYKPEVFGIFAICAALISAITVFSTFKLEHAVIQSKTSAESSKIFYSALFFCFAAAIIFGIIALMVYSIFASTFLGYGLSILVVVSSFSSSVVTLHTYYALRIESYKRISMSRVIQATISSLVTIGVGLVYPMVEVLVIALIAGNLAAIKYFPRPNFCKPTLKMFLFAIKKHKNFIKYSIPGDIANNLTIQIPQVLIANMFGVKEGGFLAQTNRLLLTPSRFVGSAVRETLYRSALSASFDKQHDNRILLFFTALLVNSLIAIPAFSLLYAFASPLSDLIFGVGWLGIDEFLKILAPAMAMLFIFGPLTALHYTLGTQRADMIFNLMFMICVSAAIVLSESAIISVQRLAFVICVMTLLNASYVLFLLFKNRTI